MSDGPRLRKGSVLKTWTKDRGVCYLCGLKVPPPGCERAEYDIQATCDHVIPKSRGGGRRLDNLRLAHRGCNEIRGSTPHKDWRSKFKHPKHYPRFLKLLQMVSDYFGQKSSDDLAV